MVHEIKKLYDFQVKALAGLPKNVLLGWDTGCGKTIASLEHYRRHSNRLPLLIIAPASKIRTLDWEREVKEYLGDINYQTISYEKFSRKTSGAQYFTGKKPYVCLWQKYLADNPKFAVIFDEGHKGKNSQSLTGKMMFNVAQASQQFIGLSATFLPNGWVDICNYGKIFDWWKNKTEFFRDYVVTYQIPNQHWSKIVGYKQDDKLKLYWDSIAKPLKKSAALDLPKFRYQAIHIPKSKIYDNVRKTRVYRAEPLDNAPKLANGLRRTLIAERATWLADFLEGASGHTCIFYNYIEEREAILEVVPKGVTIYRQDGEKHQVPCKPDWGKLPDRSVTVAQYKSGGTGIEITYCDKIVYLSPTYSYADFSQSIGRVYRAGQTLPVTAYLLHTKNTIDADIWACIRRKKAFDVELWAKEII